MHTSRKTIEQHNNLQRPISMSIVELAHSTHHWYFTPEPILEFSPPILKIKGDNQ
jgi:hypothetical protein